MNEFEALKVDGFPIDAGLTDVGTVGPELAHLANAYVHSPRALVWRNPSSEWRLLVVLLPLASRLSLIGNPIFGHLARAWGLNIRFIGIDRQRLVYDFRSLLSDRSIRLLVQTLAQPSSRPDDAALDVLFSTLASDLLTVLERRRDDWGRHLMREHRLESAVQGTLFDRDSRFPDFLGKLRESLREEMIDVHFYGRALRSIDLREAAIEQRLAAIVESTLDPIALTKLARSRIGQHLGCYNWLRIDPRHAVARAYALQRVPAFANFFADTMLTLETLQQSAGDSDEDDADDRPEALPAPPAAPTLDLRGLAARNQTRHSLHYAMLLRRAIDAGQDRAMIEALAQRFAVGDNVIRRLWREQPKALGMPPAWQISRILRELSQTAERDWPAADTEWQALIGRSVPAEAS